MHPSISYELAMTRIADLRRQARRDALARAAAHVPPGAPRSARHRILVLLRPSRRRRAYPATVGFTAAR